MALREKNYYFYDDFMTYCVEVSTVFLKRPRKISYGVFSNLTG